MTQTAAEQAAASPNGQAPAPAPDSGAPCEDCTAVSDRVMGILALLFAAALGVIALDLVFGGALSRAAGLGAKADDAGA